MIQGEIIIERGNEWIERQPTDDDKIDLFFAGKDNILFPIALTTTQLVHAVNRLAEGVTHWPMMEHLVRTGRGGLSPTSH